MSEANDALMHPVLLPEEAAQLLRITPRTLAALSRENQIPGAKMVGGSWRYSREVLLDWIAAGEQPSQQQ